MSERKAETFLVDYRQHKGEPVFDYGEPADYPPDLYGFQGVAQGVSGFDAVTAAEIAQFQRDGYLVVHDAFSPAEVQGALDGLLYLISGQNPDFHGVMLEKAAAGVDLSGMAAEAKQDYVRKFMWFVEFEPRLKTLSHHPRLTALLQQLLGEPPALFQDMALIKPPRIGREKPWHQDHAYFNLELNTPVVGVWVALDAATVDNGCMVIVPGSHRQGPVIHFQRRDWQLCDTETGRQGAMAVPLQPGGCLFFHSLLHHGTPVNYSTQRRRAVQFHYRPASAQEIAVERRLAVFGSEGKDVTC